MARNIATILIVLSIVILGSAGDSRACDSLDEIEIVRQAHNEDILNNHSRKAGAIRTSEATGNCVIVSIIPAPDDDTVGLAWDAGSLWVSEGSDAAVYAGMIFEIDLNGNILSSFQAPGQSFLGPAPEGLAFYGIYLWNVDYLDDTIYKLTKAGEVVTSIPAPSGISSGLAWDGTHLWVSNWNSKIYKIDPADGQILSTLNAPDWERGEEPYGLAWDGTHLWVSNSNGIYKIDPVSGSIFIACQNSDFRYGKAYGLTWDGQYLWAGSWISSTIVKIDVSNQAPDSNGEDGGDGGGGGCFIGTLFSE